MKKLVHAALCLLAIAPWMLAMFALWLSALLALLAHRIWPDADRGNCWTYVWPRYWMHGGYVVMRPADGQRVLGLFPVPHVMWLRKWGSGNDVRQTVPVERRRKPLPWYTLYFRYRVVETERPHDSQWGGL